MGQLKAQPLSLLSKLGAYSFSFVEKHQRPKLIEALKKRDFEEALSVCRGLSQELTFSLREYLGNARVWVRLFSLRYVNVGNSPPPAIAEALKAMEEEKRLGGTFSPRIIIEEKEGPPLYAYVIPLITQENCLPCHSQKGPYFKRLKPLYPEMRAGEEKIGSLRGAMVIYFSPEVLQAKRRP